MQRRFKAKKLPSAAEYNSKNIKRQIDRELQHQRKGEEGVSVMSLIISDLDVPKMLRYYFHPLIPYRNVAFRRQLCSDITPSC